LIRRTLGALVVLLALSTPERVSADGFSFCHSPTSGSCYNFTGGWTYNGWSSGGWSSGYGSLSSYFNNLIQTFVQKYDLGGWLDDWYDGPRDHGTSVPEPSTWLLLGTGLLTLGLTAQRRRRRIP
jgi:hypothetical protein